MTQPPTRLCPVCGIPVPGGQRFCSNCGSQLGDEGNKPTALSGENAEVSDMETRAATPLPPPPPLYDGPVYTQYPREGQQTPTPPPYQGQLSAQPSIAPAYATPQQGSSGRVWRRVGCIAGIVLLLLLGICGAAGYFVYRGASTVLSNVQKTATATGGYTSSSGVNDLTPTTGPATTTLVGSTITYASNDITIVNVQQAQSFVDDSSTSQSTGIARLNLKEQNTASRSGSFLYSSVARLVLPDGTKVEPLSEQNSVSPDASVSRTNWLDFPVSTTVDPHQLTLVLGTADDAQMSIPLTGSADLTKYKPKTSSPNKTFQHEGLTWTMTVATASWSNNAVQAKKGMIYISINFKIDNPSQNDVNEYWNSYMRLKVGDAVSSPDSNTNFPTDFPAGSSGKTATAVFLVPQGSTSYTFILLPNSSGTVSQTSTDFQIQ
ncbi:MAG: hypothetical protein NVS4B12_11290 [Ktedonobacteraceae bacterium]